MVACALFRRVPVGMTWVLPGSGLCRFSAERKMCRFSSSAPLAHRLATLQEAVTMIRRRRQLFHPVFGSGCLFILRRLLIAAHDCLVLFTSFPLPVVHTSVALLFRSRRLNLEVGCTYIVAGLRFVRARRTVKKHGILTAKIRFLSSLGFAQIYGVVVKLCSKSMARSSATFVAFLSSCCFSFCCGGHNLSSVAHRTPLLFFVLVLLRRAESLLSVASRTPFSFFFLFYFCCCGGHILYLVCLSQTALLSFFFLILLLRGAQSLSCLSVANRTPLLFFFLILLRRGAQSLSRLLQTALLSYSPAFFFRGISRKGTSNELLWRLSSPRLAGA